MTKSGIVASMGPRFLQRGNLSLFINVCPCDHSFNGATLFTAWKFLLAVHCRSCLIASMGPRFLQRGNHPHAEMGEQDNACFNGATLFTAWKCPSIVAAKNLAIEGFNGATLFTAWKWLWVNVLYDFLVNASMGPRFLQRGNEVSGITPDSTSALQWGHAFYSVEIHVNNYGKHTKSELQWGHAFYSVEIRIQTSNNTCLSNRFNGATLFTAWKFVG